MWIVMLASRRMEEAKKAARQLKEAAEKAWTGISEEECAEIQEVIKKIDIDSRITSSNRWKN